MKNDFEEFSKLRMNNIHKLAAAEQKSKIGKKLCKQLFENQYTYNFDWLGVPIIQAPADIIAIQEIIWKTKPNVIIETGVARGGSIIFYASMLKLINNNGHVIGIDIDMREHNKHVIENHPLSKNITLIQGSSTNIEIIDLIKSQISLSDNVMVLLDSNHTHDHVLKELELYSSLVTKGCYLVVLDTVVEDIPGPLSIDRAWSKGNNPKTAVHEFLLSSDRFIIDDMIHKKLIITCAPDGYLKCIK